MIGSVFDFASAGVFTGTTAHPTEGIFGAGQRIYFFCPPLLALTVLASPAIDVSPLTLPATISYLGSPEATVGSLEGAIAGIVRLEEPAIDWSCCDCET